MDKKTELIHTDKKDHYKMFINNINLGVWERSQIRQLIGYFDNII